MRSLSIIASSFLFIAAQVCAIGDCKVNAQTTVKTVTKEEPKTVKLKITGMTCASCSNHVATTLKALDGVVEQKVEYPGDVATVKYNPAKTSVADIIKAIEKIGYKAATLSEKATAKQS
jgi:mercuric ion binding protein